MTTVTVNGNTYSDAGESSKDMRDGGHRTHLLPMMSDTLVQINAAGLGTSINTPRTVTGTGAQTVANGDGTVLWAPTTPADVTFTLPAAPTSGQGHVLVYRHTSGIQYRMTIAANTGHTINGLASIVLQSAWAWVEVRYTATNQWTVTRSSGPMPNLARVSTTAMASTIARSIAVVGRYAYIGNSGGTEAFEIWDVSRPSVPVLVGSVAHSAGGSLGGLIVAGRYAYVTQNNSAAALLVVDVSNPSAPTVVKAMSVGGVVGRVMALSGHYLLLGHNGNASLRILDISNPANPVLVASLALTSVTNINAIAIAGKYAYVGTTTSGTTGFHVVDISAPASPSEVATFQTTSTGIHAVTVSGRYAYLGGSAAASGLQILNIANPAAPASIATLATNFNAAAARMPLAGSFLYFPGSGTTNALQVIDVSDPAAPVSVGAATLAQAGVQDLAVAGRHLYMVANTNTSVDGFRIYDISGLNLPAATIGALQTDVLHVDGPASFDRDLYVMGGITAGRHGIMTRGGLSVGGLSYFGDNLGIAMTQAPAGLSLGVGKALRDYNSFTDASNGEWGEFSWAANVLNIGTAKNGTGVARALQVRTDGADAIRITASQEVGIITTVPTARFHIGGTYTTANAQMETFGGTLNSSVTGSQYGLNNVPSFNPSGASLSDLLGLYSKPTVSGSATVDITNMYGITAQVETLAGYGGTITSGFGVRAAAPIIGGTNPITTYHAFYTDPITNGNGITSGTVTNYGFRSVAATAAAAVGGTINNHGAQLAVPTGSGAGTTTNYGLRITGNGGSGGSGTTTNYAIYSDSTALSLLSGMLTAPDLKATSVVSSLGLGTDSTGKLVNIATRVRATANLGKASDTTLAAVTGLSASLAAGGIYIIRGTLFTSSTINGGVKMTLATSDTLTITSFQWGAGLFTSANGGTSAIASNLGTAIGSTTPIAVVNFSGTIVVNAAGTLVVQAAQNASHVDTTTILANSFMEVVKIA